MNFESCILDIPTNNFHKVKMDTKYDHKLKK